MRSILSKATTGAMIAGAALFVVACGGGAANNTANATNDAGTAVGNEPAMAPDANAGMPDANGTAAAPAPAMDGNAAAPAAGNATGNAQ